MHTITNAIDRFTDRIGKASSWFTLILVLTIVIDVGLRYILGKSYIWLNELETYFFAIIILCGGGYALLHNAHVRVDLFYSKFSEKGKARVDLIGGLLFLLPWTLVAIKVCHRYASASFKIAERSAQPGGLPGLYVLKSILVIGFFLLFLQGLSSILKSIQILRK